MTACMQTGFKNPIDSTLQETLKWARILSHTLQLVLKSKLLLKNKFKLVASGGPSRSELCRTSLHTCKCNSCSTSQIYLIHCNGIVMYQSGVWDAASQ